MKEIVLTRKSMESVADFLPPEPLSAPAYVRPSPLHPRYFETGEGKTFIPIGLNLCFPRFSMDRHEGLYKMFRWIDRLAENGGNYARLFIGHAFFDIEGGIFGVFDAEKASRLDEVLDHAWSRGVRMKVTIDLFRSIDDGGQSEAFPGAVFFAKPNFGHRRGGPFRDMDDYLESAEGRAHFLRKLDWLAERYGEHPGILGWDLWNEMNAVSSSHWLEWTRAMLPELKRRFPRHLATQTLGSLDGDWAVQSYAEVMGLPGNEIAQVHRYLDAGASWAICHGPIDVMAADAVATLLRIAPGKPAMLTEFGAVEPHHVGPWRLYPADREGIVLHDLLFAAFFAGAAGSGQAWHWQEYVDSNNLWWHFSRFAKAIEGIDPVTECFVPKRWDTDRLRVYALKGRHVSIAWCRDHGSDWKSELVEGREAGLIHEALFLPPWKCTTANRVLFYDPWSNESSHGAWDANGQVRLPDFRRSLVVRF